MSLSDSEEETIDLSSKFGLGNDYSDDGSNSDASEDNSSDGELINEYQDEIVYSDDEENSQHESDNKKIEIVSEKINDANENKIPNLQLSDDEDDKDLANILDKKPKGKNGTFQSFGLSKKILYNITKKGYKQPTPIQRKTIPVIMSGRDVVGMARTGSGKTAAFLLPVIEKLKTHSAKVGVRCVILSPNRELALQTYSSFKEFSRGTNLRAVSLVGGDSLDSQFSAMLSNPDVVIATPGRFFHLRTEMSLNLKLVEYIVFDEADQLFEDSFETELTDLISSVSSHRQAILFSATLPKSLVNFAKIGLNNPMLVRLDTEAKISDQLEMCFISAKQQEREANLLFILQEIIKLPVSTPEILKNLDEFKTYVSESDDDDDDEHEDDKNKANLHEKGKGKGNFKKGKKFEKVKFSKANELVSPNGTIIFVPTRHHVEYIKNFLRNAGYASSYIYGTLDQHARKRQLYNFKSGLVSLLIVTDVAARGIDIPLLKYVINYTLPASSKLFVHRVGRTARAGNSGFAYSIVTPNEVPSLVEMELFLGRKILLTSMHEKKIQLLKQNCEMESKQFVEPKVSYTDRLVLGSSPRNKLEVCSDFVSTLMKDYELQVLKKVAEKAEKLYYRTKSKVTSVESLKRSKELLRSDWDEQNLLFGPNEEKAKESFLLKLQNRKKKETVFEFNKNNEKMIDFMNKRRRQIAPIQKRALERKELLDKERLAGLTHSLQDEVLKGDEAEVGFNVILEQDLKDTFEMGDADSKANKKKKSYKDENFFLSHYAPVSDIQDKQYDVGASFANDAQRATFDLDGDDRTQVHKQNQQVYKWDKSKKNYVNTRSTDQKFIISENGQRIPASYKSGRFEAWKESNRISSSSLKVGSKESNVNTAAIVRGRRYQHKSEKAPKAADKFRDDYHKQQKKIAAATERGVEIKGRKVAGKASNNEIQSTEQIRKQRNVKQKRREKNGRPSKKRKF